LRTQVNNKLTQRGCTPHEDPNDDLEYNDKITRAERSKSDTQDELKIDFIEMVKWEESVPLLYRNTDLGFLTTGVKSRQKIISEVCATFEMVVYTVRMGTQ
jgi:hypothetical protein